MKFIPNIPLSHFELLQTITCDPSNENCMFGKCDTCIERFTVESLLVAVDDMMAGEQIKWLEWVRKSEGQPEKVEKKGTVRDALSLLSHCLQDSRHTAL